MNIETKKILLAAPAAMRSCVFVYVDRNEYTPTGYRNLILFCELWDASLMNIENMRFFRRLSRCAVVFLYTLNGASIPLQGTGISFFYFVNYGDASLMNIKNKKILLAALAAIDALTVSTVFENHYENCKKKELIN